MPKNVYQGITKRAQRLLETPEGHDVEFKRTIKSLDASTIVAFANSDEGGTILIGVEEYTSIEGLQKGKIIGCPVDDEARLQIINKAVDCVPSVRVWLVAENVHEESFFRLVIHSSDSKPHATARGTYKIREDGRDRPLLPEDLLVLLIEQEGQRFQERFRQATSGFLKQLGDFEEKVQKSLKSMSDSLWAAEDNTDDAKSTLEQLEEDLGHVPRDLGEVHERVTAIIDSLSIDDPVRRRMSEALRMLFKERLKANDELVPSILDGQDITIKLPPHYARFFSEMEAKIILREVAAELADDSER